jgi:hypothetical protein
MRLLKQVALGCPNDGQRTSMRLLLGNAAILLLCLCLQVLILCLRGPSCLAWPVYVGVTITLFCLACIAIAISKVRTGSWRAWVRIYAWAAQAGISIMVVADYLAGGHEFPWILFLLPVGMLSIGVALSWRAIIPYAISSVVILLASGIAFRQIDNAIAAVMILVVVALPIVEISEIKRDLNVLREAIKVVANGKRDAE